MREQPPPTRPGLAAYATAFGSFPYGNSSAAYSLHVSLLPYLDQQPLYDSIDRRGMAYNAHSNNATACATNVAGFLCPADFRPQDVPSGWTNYAGNVGSGVQRDGYNGIFGQSSFGPSIRMVDITDRSTHTVAMAEWLLGTGDKIKVDARRTIFKTPELLAQASELDRFANLCRGLDAFPARPTSLAKGLNWLHGEFISTLYNHVPGINDRSCTNSGLVQEGAYSAGSLHPGVANALYADGHVDFARDSIGLPVWRALASRSGGEITGDRRTPASIPGCVPSAVSPRRITMPQFVRRARVVLASLLVVLSSPAAWAGGGGATDPPPPPAD